MGYVVVGIGFQVHGGRFQAMLALAIGNSDVNMMVNKSPKIHVLVIYEEV